MPLASRRLLLITASSPEIRRVRRSRVLNFQQVTMPYLAAYAPSHWTVLHVDEAVESVDLRPRSTWSPSPFTRLVRLTRMRSRPGSDSAVLWWHWAVHTLRCCQMRRRRTRT